MADVKDILQGIDALENVEGRVSIHYVGYYYNTLLKDCVFILPKVLLKDVNGKELVFGKYRPEEIANLDENNPLELEEKNFIYKFAVWIYRAIVGTVVKRLKLYNRLIVNVIENSYLCVGKKNTSNRPGKAEFGGIAKINLHGKGTKFLRNITGSSVHRV